MNRITKFLEAMTQLSKVVEVFLNVDSTVALVWGPIKFVLLVSEAAVNLSIMKDSFMLVNLILTAIGSWHLGRDP